MSLKLTPAEIARAKEIGLDLPEHHTKPSIDVTTGASFDGAVITSGMAEVAREFTELQRLKDRTMLAIEDPDDEGLILNQRSAYHQFIHD